MLGDKGSADLGPGAHLGQFAGVPGNIDGVIMSRGILSGGILSGGILSWGDIVPGILSGGYCPGGYCPGGYCPGGGDIVLLPLYQ